MLLSDCKAPIDEGETARIVLPYGVIRVQKIKRFYFIEAQGNGQITPYLNGTLHWETILRECNVAPWEREQWKLCKDHITLPFEL